MLLWWQISSMSGVLLKDCLIQVESTSHQKYLKKGRFFFSCSGSWSATWSSVLFPCCLFELTLRKGSGVIRVSASDRYGCSACRPSIMRWEAVLLSVFYDPSISYLQLCRQVIARSRCAISWRFLIFIFSAGWLHASAACLTRLPV